MKQVPTDHLLRARGPTLDLHVGSAPERTDVAPLLGEDTTEALLDRTIQCPPRLSPDFVRRRIVGIMVAEKFVEADKSATLDDALEHDSREVVVAFGVRGEIAFGRQDMVHSTAKGQS